MSNLKSISKIKEIFLQGGNILSHLKSQNGENDWESIMISYDFQSGSYTKLALQNHVYIDKYTNAIKSVLDSLEKFGSIMEVGVGEATIMNPLMKKIDSDNQMDKFGFDISWSRIRYAKSNSEREGINSKLFVANLFDIPLPDNSIDVVYTSHSLEPNGGKEKEALKELYRVASKYVVLLEPDFQNASKEGKERMTSHGYVKNLAEHASALNFNVIESRPFDIYINPLNPTGLTIIKKAARPENIPSYICPITRKKLIQYDNVYYCEESGLIYPIISEIPCLIESSATLGFHFKDFVGKN